MSLPLSGKVAIVTGSSRGIGASIARRLATDGASVVINYFGSAQAAEDVVQEINTEGKGKAVAMRADVSSVAEGVRLVNETVQHFGKLDLLVLNAGLMNNGALSELDEKSFDDHFNINVKVPLFMVKEAAKHFHSGARVFFFSSSTTKYSGVPPNYAVYTATKGAVEQMTRVLSKDLGSRGINVNCIAPGPVDTELFRHGKSEQPRLRRKSILAPLLPTH